MLGSPVVADGPAPSRDRSTMRPSTPRVPVTQPSGTLASSLVRGSGARCSSAGRSCCSGGWGLLTVRSQWAVCCPMTAFPPELAGTRGRTGGKAANTCLTTTGGRPWLRSARVHHRAADSRPCRGRCLV